MKLRKILTFLLLFAMLLGTFPLYAIAAGEDETAEPEAQSTVEDGINISIEEDLTVKYHAVSGDKAVFTITGKAPVTVTEYTTDDEGRYVFAFSGIGPHQIGEAIDIEIYNGEEVVATKDAFTITGYCETLLTTYSTDTKLAALVADLLAYGQAAEAYIKGSSDITVTGTPSTVTPTADDNKLDTSGNTDALYIASAGVRFDYINRLYFKIASTGGAFTAAIDGKTYEASKLDIIDGYYVVYSDAIAPTEYDTVKTLTVTEDEKTVTIDYSANSYAYRMQNDEKMGTLALALYRFGKSCIDYGTSSTPEIYTITYNANQGTLPADAPKEYDSAVGATLPKPTKAGYAFAGWYPTEACTAETRVRTIAAGETGDKVLYAKWCKSVIEEDYTGKNFNLSGKHEGTIKHKPNNSATMKTVTGTDENTYLRIDKPTGGSNAIVFSNGCGGLNAFKTNAVSFEISFSKVENVTVTELYFQLIGSGNPELFRVNNDGTVKLNGGTKTLGTVTEDGFTKIRIAVDLTSKAVTAYDEKGNTLETVTVNSINKTAITDYLFYINLRPHSTLATAVLIDDIRVADGNIFGNGTTENNIVIDEDYTGESFDISGNTEITTHISSVSLKPNNTGAAMQTVTGTDGNTYLRVDKPVHANNSLIYKNDGKGFAAFAENQVSFEISFSKVEDVTVTNLDFMIVDGSGSTTSLFTVNNDGTVKLNGGTVNLGTVTEGVFTKIRIALDFDSKKVIAYGEDGKILDAVSISKEKKDIPKYLLYINVKQNASLATAVLIDDIRIIDGNIFAK